MGTQNALDGARGAEEGRDSIARGAAEPSRISHHVTAMLSTAAAIGLRQGEKKRVSGYVHVALMDAAVARSGLEGSDLLEYALAKVALEDDFVEQLLGRAGTVNRDIDLGI